MGEFDAGRRAVDNIFDFRSAGKLGDKQKTPEAQIQNIGQALEDGKLTKEEFKALAIKALQVSQETGYMQASDDFVQRMSDILSVDKTELQSFDYDPAEFKFNKLDNGSIVVTDGKPANEPFLKNENEVQYMAEHGEFTQGVNLINLDGESVRGLIETKNKAIDEAKARFSDLEGALDRAAEKKNQNALNRLSNAMANLMPGTDFGMATMQAQNAYSTEIANIQLQKQSLLDKGRTRMEKEIANAEKQYNQGVEVISPSESKNPFIKKFEDIDAVYKKELERLEATYNDQKDMINSDYNDETDGANRIFDDSMRVINMGPNNIQSITDRIDATNQLARSRDDAFIKKQDAMSKADQELEEAKDRLKERYNESIEHLTQEFPNRDNIYIP